MAISARRLQEAFPHLRKLDVEDLRAAISDCDICECASILARHGGRFYGWINLRDEYSSPAWGTAVDAGDPYRLTLIALDRNKGITLGCWGDYAEKRGR